MSELIGSIGQTQNHKEALSTLAEAKNDQNMERSDIPQTCGTEGVNKIEQYLNAHELLIVQKQGEPFLWDTMNNETQSMGDVSALKALISPNYDGDMSDKIYAMDLENTYSIPQTEISNHIQLPTNEEEDIKRKRKQKKYMGY